MWTKIITIKRTKDLNYFSLCGLNSLNTWVLSWITEINELFHDILIYWDAPVYIFAQKVQFSGHSHRNQVETAFHHWIYKNYFRFKKCFNIALNTDGHIIFYLNYHSVGYLTMYYVLLKGFKLIQILVISYLQIFSNFFSSVPLSSDIFTLKGWSIRKTVTTTSPFELNFQHHNFADVLYSQTATLHTNESLKSEIIINDPFKYPRYFKINILIIITFACSRFSDIG